MTLTISNQPEPRALKLAFISPINLFDDGNGAARSLRTMLGQLSKRGFLCHALTACCFDVPPGESLPGRLSGHGLSPTGVLKEFGVSVWQGVVQGVGYNAVQFATQKRDQLTASEELVFRDTVRIWLEENRPDIVITFGGLLLDIEIQRCAKAAGAAVAFYLANPHYGRRETFANVDLILTNSSATVAHYANTMGLQCHNIGLFVDPEPIVAVARQPQFVTFINPVQEKGVSLFLKLVQRAHSVAPDMRFLVVESRGTLVNAMQRLGFPAELLAQITVLPQQQKMAAIYAQTRVLLMPSFWFETAGRILIEANANGIPVIAANRGGIAETLGDAGRVLPIPERCMTDYWHIPSDEEVQPWWDELLTLWRANAYYEVQAKKAHVAAQIQSIESKAAKLQQLLISLRGRAI